MHFLRAILVGFLASSAAVSALPTASPSPSPALSEPATELAGWLAARRSEGSKVTRCDVSRVTLPTNSATSLTAPDSSVKLRNVALGRGTQNYTCASDDSTPVAAGAAATLYDASCLAANNPTLLHLLPNALLALTPKIASYLYTSLNLSPLVLGHHYFAPDASTPVFDISDPGSKRFVGTKLESAAAPDGASKGVVGQDYGAVDWLRLGKNYDVKTYSTGEVAWGKYVYRVVTAGGKAPTTCEGREKEFEIQYAAEYWFYN
ncbi:hypothetical protein RUND412_004844 [Rhizina undulata]